MQNITFASAELKVLYREQSITYYPHFTDGNLNAKELKPLTK